MTIVAIESVPSVGADVFLRALSAAGVEGAVVTEEPRLELRVPDGDLDGLSRRVAAALERVVDALPHELVPERVGPTSFSVHPPAA